MIEVKARYSNGVLKLLEPVDLKEGEEVPELSVEERIEKLRATAGEWKGLHDPDESKRMIYQARIDGSRYTPKP